MRLRQQLLILSLLMLCLPWAGCQYAREVEALLADGQRQVLTASAQAIALRFAEEPGLFDGADEVTASNAVYFHPLNALPVLDGFSDEWRQWSIEPAPLVALFASGDAGSYPLTSVPPSSQSRPSADRTLIQARAGVKRQTYFVFVDIQDRTPTYLDPSFDPLLSGDHLMLLLGSEPRVLATGAPGQLLARYRDSEGQIRTDHRISAVWTDTRQGHQIEIRIRQDALQTGQLGLVYADRTPDFNEPARYFALGASDVFLSETNDHLIFKSAKPSALRQPSPRLQRDLDVFQKTELRLALTDRSGWVLASTGDLSSTPPPGPLSEDAGDTQGDAADSVTDWLYRHLFRSQSLPELDNWRAQGRFDSLDVTSALLGRVRHAGFNLQGQRVTRVAIPIQRGKGPSREILGAVVAEQTSESVTALANTALNRLLVWTLIAAVFVTLGLLSYAGILSLRVRRLSQAAERALADDMDSIVNADLFPVSRFADEIGDLSRSYRELLHRLGEYNSYLRTLSQKLSHELRTPLAVVRTSLDNFAGEDLSEHEQRYLSRAIQGSERLSSILNAMSSASHLEASIAGTELERIDLADLVKSLHQAYQDAYPHTQFKLRLPEGDSVNTHLDVAPDLIVQALDKLVDNAADFCPADGHVVLALSGNDSELELAVENDGPPLPDQMGKQLFDSLVSVRSGKSERSHLGLGLYIVRLIAEFHQARIRAENRPQGGVRFGLIFATER